MPLRKLDNYLRTYRKYADLTQNEVAFLLGTQSGTKVSRYERFYRQPSLSTIFSYEIIFNLPAKKLFPGLFQKVQDKTLRRAELLIAKLSRHPQSNQTDRRIGFLKEIIKRAFEEQ